MSNEKLLLRRVATLEVAVARLQQAMGGMMNVMAAASEAGVECDECGNDFTAMKTCAVENCPCGVPFELEEKEDVSDTDDRSD